MKLLSSSLLSYGKGTLMLCSLIAFSSYANEPTDVVDLLPPVISLNGDRFITQAHGVKYEELGASALDAIDGQVNVTVYSGVDVDRLGDYRIFYRATDLSGNTASVTRIVTVSDQTPPVLTLEGEEALILPHNSDYQELGANALDNVDGEINVIVSGYVNTRSIGDYTLTYTAMDSAGNESTLTRQITVIDRLAPVISLNKSQVITQAYGVTYQEWGAVAFDDVDGNLDVTLSGHVDVQSIGINTVTYHAQDSTGNQSSLTRTVHVSDLTPPVITLSGQHDIITAYGGKYVELGAIAEDDFDNQVTVSISGKVNTHALGNYTVSYQAQDAAGNQSTLTRTVTVSDLSPPVITLTGQREMIAAYGGEYKELGATAMDDLDGAVEVKITGQVDSHKLDDYTLTYTAKDTAGNQSTLTRTVAIADLTAPVLNLQGDNAIIHAYGTAYQDLGATVKDDLDSEVAVIVNDGVNSNAIGDHTVTYTAQDTAGNQSRLTRKVKVADLTPPNISLIGSDKLTTAYGVAYHELGATVIDDLDSAVEVQVSGEVNTNILGDYVLTYRAQDAAGNQSTLIRTVSVQDLTPPVVTLNGASSVEYAYRDQYKELGATATDDLDREVEVKITGSVNSTVLGDYPITYRATDKAGNTGTYTRVVTIIDVTAPVISLNGEHALSLPYAEKYVELGAVASDDVDNDIKVQVSGSINNGAVGDYIMTYRATDQSGNRSTMVRTVRVVDITPPVITINGSNPFTHAYGVEYADLGAIALDDVDGSVTVGQETRVDIDKIDDYTVIYTATDAAGNQSSATRSVAIRDLTAPVITLAGANPIILGVGRKYEEYGATALDDLDGQIPVARPIGKVDSDKLGTYPLTYTTVDAAGNKSTVTRHVNIVQSRPFISRWKTSNNYESFTLPINDALNGFNYTVDWGDRSPPENINGRDATHTYDAAGHYNITISGNFPGLGGCSELDASLVSIEQWGDIAWPSFDSAFKDCQNLVINDQQVPDLSKIKSMRYAFSGATKFNSDISLWDVSTVTDMSYLFRGASHFNQNLARWDVSAVTDMSYMFRHASAFNQDIASWDVSAVENMWYMFSYAAAFDQDLSRWNVSAVNKMTGMFSYANAFNQDIADWDVSAVTTMNMMFFNATAFNQDISHWDVSAVTYMYYMFSNARAFNQDISRWDVSRVTNMCNMFRGAVSFNQDISRWDVSSVNNMSGMFANATAFNQNLGIWDVHAATNMSAMFFNAAAFNQPLSNWNVSRVTDMSSMFEGATAFNQDISRWDVSKVRLMQKMLDGAAVFNGNISRWSVSAVTNMEQMFNGASAFNQDLSRWDISSVSSMYQMFEGVTLSEKNYDALLIHWSTRDVQKDVFFSAGNSLHSQAAQPAIAILKAKSWTITDGASL